MESERRVWHESTTGLTTRNGWGGLGEKNFDIIPIDLHEGRVTSKLDGVRWAKTHLAPKWHALIDYCWQERQDTAIHISQPADPQVFKQTIAFSEYATLLGEEYHLPSV